MKLVWQAQRLQPRLLCWLNSPDSKHAYRRSIYRMQDWPLLNLRRDAIYSNQLTTCPASSASNLFTGDLSSSIDLENAQLYKDKDIVATLDYCNYLAGDFVFILAAVYIPNIMHNNNNHRDIRYIS